MTVVPLLCALLVASHAPAGGLAGSYEGTRVRGHEQALELASGPSRASSPRTRWASPCTYGETASDRTKQYNGRVYDQGTGFHDYGARLYWPEIGRFISADSYLGDPGNPASLNRYSYVHNNPYKYTDPTGHFAFVPALYAAGAWCAMGGCQRLLGLLEAAVEMAPAVEASLQQINLPPVDAGPRPRSGGRRSGRVRSDGNGGGNRRTRAGRRSAGSDHHDAGEGRTFPRRAAARRTRQLPSGSGGRGTAHHARHPDLQEDREALYAGRHLRQGRQVPGAYRRYGSWPRGSPEPALPSGDGASER